MQTVTTSKGKTYKTLFASDTADGGRFLLQIEEEKRLLSEIAPEFEGIESIHVHDEDIGDKDFGGFPVLIGLERKGEGLLVKLERGDES